MEYDIEDYLDGKLTGAALAAFEQALIDNPTFRTEVEQQRLLNEQVKRQLLREQVNAALAEDKGNLGARKFPWFPLLGLVLLIAIGGYFSFRQTAQSTTIPASQSTINTLQETEQAPSSTSPLPEEKQPQQQDDNSSSPNQIPPKKESSTTPPIAQNDPAATLAPPLYPSPNVRGNNTTDEAWQKLMDAIWYTDFPPANTSFGNNFDRTAKLLTERKFSNAYVRLQRLERKLPENDTLAFLKGYCLLEMGEGEEANRYFGQLGDHLIDWQTQKEWYSGLSFLIAGDREKAIAIFKKIAASQTHGYRPQSLKALDLLQ